DGTRIDPKHIFDTADFNALEVFGSVPPTSSLTLSQVDQEIMDVLGWSPSKAAGVSDFNGDRSTDLVWQNGTTFTEWQSNGSAFTPNVYVGSVASGWTLAGIGAFTGNGQSDLLWFNNGTFTIWDSTGSGFTANSFVGSVAPGWTLSANTDFNGDGG